MVEHIFSISFLLETDEWDVDKINVADIKAALLRRIESLQPDEWREAVSLEESNEI